MKSFCYCFVYSLAVFFLAALFFLPVNKVSAQAVSGISISISPESPKPEEKVTATLTSYEVDLGRVMIYWSLNGKVVLSGRGKDSYSFSVGRVGSVSRISASVQSDRGILSDSKNITPTDIDVLWQATDSYTPPFYRGKALPTQESSLRFVAMPNMVSGGSQIRPSTLVYSWTKNGKRISDASGYGNNYYEFKNNYLDARENIDVDVSTVNNSLSGKSSVSVSFRDPKILLYERHPLRGIIYSKALGVLNMKNKEIEVLAEPYFISAQNRKDEQIFYSWTLNRQNVSSSPGNPESLILRDDGGNGTAQVGVEVRRDKKMFQTGNGNIVVNFGK